MVTWYNLGRLLSSTYRMLLLQLIIEHSVWACRLTRLTNRTVVASPVGIADTLIWHSTFTSNYANQKTLELPAYLLPQPGRFSHSVQFVPLHPVLQLNRIHAIS